METIVAALKSEMTYPSSLIEETLNYKGYTIKIEHDTDARNPYKDGDYMAPAIWFYDRSYANYAPELHNPFDYYTDNQISRHWRKICDIFGFIEAEHQQEIKQYQENWPDPTGQVRRAIFEEHTAGLKGHGWSSAIQYLETLAALYNLIGIPAFTEQSNGYCQGDSSYGLIIYTPEFQEAMGLKPDHDFAKAAKGEAETYGDWAWGNMYGYVISKDDEVLDSCWGFRGSDPDCMLEAITDQLQYYERQRQKRLKTLIRNRVPLGVRNAELSAPGF